MSFARKHRRAHRNDPKGPPPLAFTDSKGRTVVVENHGMDLDAMLYGTGVKRLPAKPILLLPHQHEAFREARHRAHIEGLGDVVLGGPDHVWFDGVEVTVASMPTDLKTTKGPA